MRNKETAIAFFDYSKRANAIHEFEPNDLKSNRPANVNVCDNGDEFRVEVADRFAGDAVSAVQRLWEKVLRESGSRRFAIDISQLTDYDHAGFELLHKMRLHGAHIVASTPQSLVILNEISGPLILGLALLRKSPQRQHYSEGKQGGNLLPFPNVRTGSDD